MNDRPPSIETPRFQLVALVPAEIRALIAKDTVRAGAVAGVVFPTGWPEEQEVRDGLPWHLRHLESDDRQLPWRVRVVVERASRRVVGSINLKGFPDTFGDVEIGWGIDHDCRRQGFASEAASAVAAWVTTQAGVKSLTATIPDENIPSRHLAARLGMQRTSEKRRDLPLWRRVAA